MRIKILFFPVTRFLLRRSASTAMAGRILALVSVRIRDVI
jgi:hypothetical protein